jgi:hypothetical protein
VFGSRNLALYSYTWNNPVRYIDPNGMVCADTGASGSCGGGSGTLDLGLVDLPTFEREPVPILASMTPVVGPVLDFRADVESGHFGWAGVDAVFAFLDAFSFGMTSPVHGVMQAEAREVPRAIIRQDAAAAEATSSQARRQVMLEQGIPTSQQPVSQGRNASGRYQQYEVPKAGGGTETKSVQQQTLDRSHPGQGHWEAGRVKRDPITGQVLSNKYGSPRLTNDKSKANYQTPKAVNR